MAKSPILRKIHRKKRNVEYAHSTMVLVAVIQHWGCKDDDPAETPGLVASRAKGQQ